jgi:hypothetical protein
MVRTLGVNSVQAFRGQRSLVLYQLPNSRLVATQILGALGVNVP